MAKIYNFILFIVIVIFSFYICIDAIITQEKDKKEKECKDSVNTKNKMVENYIKERMTFYAMNINDFVIGQILIDKDGSKCFVINKTANSIEVLIDAKTSHGIRCSQWFDMNAFNKRFK